MMNIQLNRTNVLTIVVVLLLVYFLYKNQINPIHNEGTLDYEEEGEEAMVDVDIPENELVDIEEESSDKFNARNKATSGFKSSNYAESKRASGGNWEKHFDDNNNLINSSNTNNEFTPLDETNDGYASYQNQGNAPCASGTQCSPEDLFDVDNYLPKEKNDWFDVPEEPISVKNRHLINTTAHVGVDTKGSTSRNASRDLRGTIVNPRSVVSPWNQSSIDPDTNINKGI